MTLSFDLDAIRELDAYARLVAQRPKLSITEFESMPEGGSGQWSRHLTKLENELSALIVPRLILNVTDDTGHEVVATTYADAHELRDGKWWVRPHQRRSGLTEEGEAWALFASLVVSASTITDKLLSPTRTSAPSGFGMSAPSRVSVRRSSHFDELDKRVAAFRHVADLLDRGATIAPSKLAELLDEGPDVRAGRIRREMFASVAKATRDIGEIEPD